MTMHVLEVSSRQPISLIQFVYCKDLMLLQRNQAEGRLELAQFHEFV